MDGTLSEGPIALDDNDILQSVFLISEMGAAPIPEMSCMITNGTDHHT